MQPEFLQDRFQARLDAHGRSRSPVALSNARHGEDRRDRLSEMRVQWWSTFLRYDERRALATRTCRSVPYVTLSCAQRHARVNKSATSAYFVVPPARRNLARALAVQVEHSAQES